jgi:O-antigen/teichoic acid export membrane protein
VPILNLFRSFQEVGWYQLAYKPFESLQFVPLALQAVVYPVLAVYYSSAKDRLGLAYQRFFKILVLLGWPISIGTLVLTHPIGRLFHLFPQSEPSLRILALGIVFLFVNSAFTAMLYSIDRQDLFAWVTAIAVVVNVLLTLLFFVGVFLAIFWTPGLLLGLFVVAYAADSRTFSQSLDPQVRRARVAEAAVRLRGGWLDSPARPE